MSVIRSLKSTAWGQWLLNLIPVSLKASLRQRLDRWNAPSIERQNLVHYIAAEKLKEKYAFITAENHFEPTRFFVRMPNGHRPKFGPVARIAEPN